MYSLSLSISILGFCTLNPESSANGGKIVLPQKKREKLLPIVETAKSSPTRQRCLDKLVIFAKQKLNICVNTGAITAALRKKWPTIRYVSYLKTFST